MLNGRIMMMTLRVIATCHKN